MSFVFRLNVVLLATFMFVMPATAQDDSNPTGGGSSLGKEQYTNLEDFPGTDVLSATADFFVTGGARPGSIGTLTEEQRKKIFVLYNVGQKKFLTSGGVWGTSASLGNVGMFLWIEKTGMEGKLNLHTNQTAVSDAIDAAGGGKVGYLQYESSGTPVGTYIDSKDTGNGTGGGWIFTKVATSNNHNIYTLSTTVGSTTYYLTAVPDDAKGNYVQSLTSAPTDDNGHWKVICLADYIELFNVAPSDLTSPTDATFLIRDASFSVNNRYLTEWQVEGDGIGDFRFGSKTLYKRGETTPNLLPIPIPSEELAKIPGYMNSQRYENWYSFNYDIQRNYGAYYDAYTTSNKAVKLYQDVKVDRDGWYIVCCNGFSNANTETSTFARLFASEVKDNAETENAVSTPLNPITNDEITSKDLKGNDWTNAGKAFAEGKYVNQVMIHINNGNHNSDASKAGGTIRLGMTVTEHVAVADEWTALDNFRLLYAGDTQAPDLVLDEEDTGLDTLYHTTDGYANSTLHLNRKFTLGKWNTLVLPVNLTRSQVNDAFGAETQVAYLKNLTSNSMQFEKVVDKTGGDVLIQAYHPYIIKPTKDPGETPEYRTPKLTATEEGWSGEEKTLTLHVKANHYIIPMVTLDRTLLKRTDYLDPSDWTVAWNANNEGHQAVFADGTIDAKGTMGMTYEVTTNGTGKIIEGRDNLSNDYYMARGAMYRVPSGKVYGLKAFRVWFEQGVKGSSDAKPKAFVDDDELSVFDNGSTTGITFVSSNGVSEKATAAEGVYSISGKRVRNGNGTEGLPAGVYIVGGKKILVK